MFHREEVMDWSLIQEQMPIVIHALNVGFLHAQIVCCDAFGRYSFGIGDLLRVHEQLGTAQLFAGRKLERKMVVPVVCQRLPHSVRDQNRCLGDSGYPADDSAVDYLFLPRLGAEE